MALSLTMPQDMTTIAARRMQRFGGSFAQAIGAAYFVADPDNRAKLVETFADLFASYYVDPEAV